MKIKSISLAFVMTCLSASLSQGLRADTLNDPIDQYINAELTRQQVPGMALLVMRHGQLVRAQGYGLANLEHHVPMHADSLFKTGAVGMQFTAVAVMLLVEEGKLGLDESVRKYLPNTPRSWEPITIRNLLNHTSGLPATPGGEFLVEYTNDELLAVIGKLPLNFAASTRWRFSFSDYIVLGFVIDKITGKHYTELLAERLFGPLNMHTAQPIDELAVIPNRATGYEMNEGKPRHPPAISAFANSTADGSLFLSALDYAAWSGGGLGRKLLQPASWAQLSQPAQLKSGRTYPYGFGWFHERRAGHAVWQHTGGWQGFQAAIASYRTDASVNDGPTGNPTDDWTVVALANGSNANPAEIIRHVAALLDAKLKQPAAMPLADREPQITGQVTTLLQQLAAGTTSPADFTDFSKRDFSDMTTEYQKVLSPLGTLHELALFARRQLGDDEVYQYRARYERGMVEISVGYAPHEATRAAKIGSLDLMPIDDWNMPIAQ